MSTLHFTNRHLYILNDTIDLAETLVMDYFNLSQDDWKDYRYEIKTRADLKQEELTDKAFAQICKYECVKKREKDPPLSFDLYRICLQDNWILHAVKRSLKEVGLRPLMTYILTHELAHVVRFSKYYKDFFADPEEKELEEAVVHSITYEMLKSLGDKDVDGVLSRYKEYRWNLMEV